MKGRKIFLSFLAVVLIFTLIGSCLMIHSIIMPNIKPAWITVMIFTFQGIWNSTSSQQFVFTESLRTLPTMMSQIISGNTIARAGVGSAASVFLMMPPIILFIFSQTRVVETMAFAGIKE